MALLALCWPAAAQIQQLVTTNDGSVVYFSSSIREAGTTKPPYSRIYAADDRGVRVLVEREPSARPQFSPYYNEVFFNLIAPDVSGDGSVFGFTGTRPCTGGSGCIFIERYMGEIAGAGRPENLKMPGTVRLSRNGRWAVASGGTGYYPWGDAAVSIDVASGKTQSLGTRASGRVPAGGARVVADDGTALLIAVNEIVAVKAGGAPTRLPAGAEGAVIADTGAFAIYTGADARLHRLDLRSGAETALTGLFSNPSQPVLSADSTTLLFLAQAQVWLMDLATGRARQMTRWPAGVREATLSGNGQRIWAATDDGVLIRIDMARPLATEVVARTLRVAEQVLASAPGSMLQIDVAGAADDAEVRIGGVRVPLLFVSREQIRVQLPWTTPAGALPIEISAPSVRFEEGPALTVEVRPVQPRFVKTAAVHGDFRGLVSEIDPAVAGEIVHFYMTGLGEVSPAVETDAPGPADPPARVLAQLPWEFRTEHGDTQPAEVLFAGLAPQMYGIYQVSVRLPETVNGSQLGFGPHDGEAVNVLLREPQSN